MEISPSNTSRAVPVSGGEKGARNSGDGFAGIGRLAGEFS
jgi:hypothetical protein